MRITFRINLSNQNLLDPNIADTITTWISNRFGGNYVFKHGDIVTLDDYDAAYFLENHAGNSVVEDLHIESTATGTARMIPVGTPTLIATFQNAVGEILTVAGGTFSEVTKIVVDSVHTVAGQNQINFSPGEDNGTFTGGDGYAISDTITLSDGTVVVVDTVNVGETTNVLTFHITVESTTPITTNHPTLTQTSTSGSGTGFTLTLGTANQRIEDASYKQTGGVNEGIYTVLPSNPVTVTTSASFTISWGVKSVVLTANGNEYASAPAVSFTGGAGSGTTATAVLTGDSVSSITINTAGSGYTSTPTVTIANP